MQVSLKELLEAGCHFGHQTVRWNPKMKPYIFTAREGVHVFDLAKTKEGLETACDFAKSIVSQGGLVLFVGSKRQAREIVLEVSKKIGMPYVTQRWMGGMITNWDQVKKRVEKMAELKEGLASGTYKTYTKKEQLLIERQLAKLEKFFGGIADVKDLPQALFIVDAKRELSAVKEANRRGIPVISMVDTNSDPDLIDYVIPVNDDAVSSIKLIVEKMGESVEEGMKLNKNKKPDNTETLKETETLKPEILK